VRVVVLLEALLDGSTRVGAPPVGSLGEARTKKAVGDEPVYEYPYRHALWHGVD
jgi:hypothetical protein